MGGSMSISSRCESVVCGCPFLFVLCVKEDLRIGELQGA